MSTLQKICLSVTIIGAINWGLISLFKFDLVAAILAGGAKFGNINGLSRIIYGLVGLSGLYVLFEYLMNRF